MTDLAKAIFLMGPTASGKTDLAIELTRRLPCDIISVDSALVYRGMDIGSAKPSKAELALAPHALLDIRDPGEAYSAADFRQDALKLMGEISAKGRIPLLVGGTMLYFKALIDGLSPLPSADSEIRSDIEHQASTLGWAALHDELAYIDPVSAKRIHPNDPQRLSRALEVYRISGKTLTELTQIKSEPFPYHAFQFAIAPKDRSMLHKRIELRFKLMLDQGFEQEVKALYQRDDLNKDLPSIRCVGYRQMWEHLEGSIDFDEMLYRGIVATRQLAKRQMTWLRSWEDLTWLETGNRQNLDKIVQLVG